MKNNILKHFFLAAATILGLSSCEDREIITVENQSAPIVMDLSAQNLVLDSNFPANPALTINWEAATFTVPVEVKYTVEISASEAFTNPQTLVLSTMDNFRSFTTLEMNNAAKKIGLVPDVVQKMYFRVSSFTGSNNDLLQKSNVTVLSIKPYLARPTYNFSELFLIGDATAGGWDNLITNGNLIPMLKTSDASKYEFTGLFKVGGFKMIRVKGDWTAQFGLGTASGVLSTDGGSGDIKILTEGYYKLTVDTTSLTYTLVPATNPATTYTNLSMIGTSTNGADIQLTKSAFDAHLWTAKNTTLKAGVFKFRANNAWDVNWGTNSEYFGVGVAGGADIPLSADWKYDIYFNDVTGNYTIIPTE